MAVPASNHVHTPATWSPHIPTGVVVERMQLGGVNPTYRVTSAHAPHALFLKAAPREHIAREVKAVAIARLMGLDRYVRRRLSDDAARRRR